MAIPAVLTSVLSIGVQTVGNQAIDELAGKMGGLEKTFKSLGRAGMKQVLGNLFKPPGLDEIQIFRFARGLNTIAANIRFLQLTLITFIGGNVVKGFMGLFINLNAEIQSASLSLEAIVEAQRDMAMRAKLGIGPSAIMSPQNKSILKKQIARDVSELTNYASTLAMKTGGSIPEMIQTARGIQVNTKDVDATKRFMDVAANLALLDPQQGLAGATFSIRELLQGQGARDFTSLAQRFELSFSMEFKKKFTDSVKSGDIKKAIQMFEEELAGKGISSKILKNLEKSWILSMNVIKNNIALSFASLGKPLFDMIGKELFQFSSFFFKGRGKDLDTIPEFKILKTGVGSILVDYIGKPLRNSVNSLIDYLLGFINTRTFAYIRTNLDSLVGSLSGVMTLFKNVFTTLFDRLGTLPANGDLFRGALNTIGLLIERFTSLIKVFVSDPEFLKTLDGYVTSWAKYVKVMLSPESQKTMLQWSKMSLWWKTFFMDLHTGWAEFVNVITPHISKLGDDLKIIYNTADLIMKWFYVTIDLLNLGLASIATKISLTSNLLKNVFTDPINTFKMMKEASNALRSNDRTKHSAIMDQLTGFQYTKQGALDYQTYRNFEKTLGIKMYDKWAPGLLTTSQYYGMDFSTGINTSSNSLQELTKEQNEIIEKAINRIDKYNTSLDKVFKDLNITSKEVKDEIKTHFKNQRLDKSFNSANNNSEI